MNPNRVVRTSTIVVVWALSLVWMWPEALALQEPPDSRFDSQAILKAQPLKHAAGDTELQKLLKDRYNAALMATQARMRLNEAGQCPIEAVFEDAKHMLNSEFELSDVPAERVKVREKQLRLAQALEKTAQVKHDAGKLSDADYQHARYFRLDAQVQLLRATQAAEAGKRK